MLTARNEYKETGLVPSWWNFHPAYVYGNERVSCRFCILGCQGDLKNAANHAPELLQQLIALEDESGFTFTKTFSLKSLLP